MKSLVTGGAGFIGNHLVSALLARGHEVVVVDTLKRGNKIDKDQLEKLKLIIGDVRDKDLIFDATEGCDYVFHLAAMLGVDIVADNPVETMEVETKGLQNVAQACVRHGVINLAYASTSGIYGKSAIEQAVEEDFAVAPSTSYAISKRYNEIYLNAMHEEKGLNSISMRYFNVYGPKQDNRMVIPRFLKQARAGKPLTVFGSGEQTRDFTYVDDAVEATLQATEKIRGCEILNISHSREFSIKELAEIIIEKTGSSSEISLTTPPKGRYDFEVERRFGNPAKLKRLTGCELSMPLRDGLKKILEYDSKVE